MRTWKDYLAIFGFVLFGIAFILTFVNNCIILSTLSQAKNSALNAASILVMIGIIISFVIGLVSGFIKTVSNGFSGELIHSISIPLLAMMIVDSISTIITIVEFNKLYGQDAGTYSTSLVISMIFYIFVAITAIVSLVMQFSSYNETGSIISLLIGIIFLIVIVFIGLIISNSQLGVLGIIGAVLELLGFVFFTASLAGCLQGETTFSHYYNTTHNAYNHNSSVGGALKTFRKGDMVSNIFSINGSNGEVAPAGTVFEIVSATEYLCDLVRVDTGTKYPGIAKAKLNPYENKTIEIVKPAPSQKEEKNQDAYENLKELKDLLDKGIITEEEYKEKRKKYIDKL